MTTNTLPEARLKSGQASLDEMMMTLRDFMPKPDAALPEPASQWHLAELRPGESPNCADNGTLLPAI